jgi:hypothetical protein
MILRDNTAIKPTLFKGGSQNPMTSVVRVRQTVIGITMYHVKTPSPKVQGCKGARAQSTAHPRAWGTAPGARGTPGAPGCTWPVPAPALEAIPVPL